MAATLTQWLAEIEKRLDVDLPNGRLRALPTPAARFDNILKRLDRAYRKTRNPDAARRELATNEGMNDPVSEWLRRLDAALDVRLF